LCAPPITAGTSRLQAIVADGCAEAVIGSATAIELTTSASVVFILAYADRGAL
jgi:hypothetical protein